MSEAIERRFDELASLHDEYAKAQSLADFLDDMTKTLLAQYMAQAEAKGAKSAAIQERDARLSAEFSQHLEAKRIAREEALKLKGQITVATMRFEAWRSRNAMRRAEIGLR